MYKHIVLAADGSENSQRAAAHASLIAKRCGNATIDIVYVSSLESARTDVLHNPKDSRELERRRRLAPIVQTLTDAEVPYKTTYLTGRASDEIIKYVNSTDADLVVIGSRGLQGIKEFALGSVSHKVMKDVNCPALIVK